MAAPGSTPMAIMPGVITLLVWLLCVFVDPGNDS
jgi:hypothetical protein